MDDRRLAERAKRGDVDAYEQLVRAHQSIAFHVAYAVTRNAGEAEDAIQEAFVKAYYALEQFEPGAAFRPWLLRIVTNEALNRVRAAERRGNLANRLAVHGGEQNHHPGPPEPEAVVLATERREIVLQALKHLNDSDRMVLTYRYLLDLSVAEIADVLAIPQRTVRSRLTRAMERLRDQIVSQTGQAAENPSTGGRK